MESAEPAIGMAWEGMVWKNSVVIQLEEWAQPTEMVALILASGRAMVTPFLLCYLFCI
jgi:hypothetical protein